MLKRRILKNICLIVACFLVIGIITIFPKKDDEFTINTNKNTGIIYLLDDNNYVSQLDIIYNGTNNFDLVKEIIDILTINNPKSLRIRNGFYAIIPEETKLIDYQIKDQTVTLNFSKEILTVRDELEEKMIEAIVYSLTALKDITRVKILVENNILEKLPHSAKKLPELLDRSIGINKEYNITTLANIKETTIFYLAKKDDYIYYVPVTKYTNSPKEKIEIIIDELKSSSTYNTNLISYISEQTELISHDTLDNTLILNFNNGILDDIDSSNIIEEVAYTINLSVQENYHIDNIMYYVDNNIIENYFLLRG